MKIVDYLRTVPPRTIDAGVIGSFVYTTVFLTIAFEVIGISESWFFWAVFAPTLDVSLMLWWGLFGTVIIGAVVGVTIERYRLVSPVLAVGVVLAFATYRTSVSIQDPYPIMSGTPFDLYIIGWPVLLGVVVFAGSVERFLWKALSVISV